MSLCGFIDNSLFRIYQTHAFALSNVLCLRQHGAPLFIGCWFFALRPKNQQQKEDKVPLCLTTSWH
jgi:hypothetical protein